jgi:hypothetical protein
VSIVEARKSLRRAGLRTGAAPQTVSPKRLPGIMEISGETVYQYLRKPRRLLLILLLRARQGTGDLK